jgi:glycosyltransferase involved in cell wall biosynthesis
MNASQSQASPPKVSVIVPSHNRLPFLRVAVASVIAQTYRHWNLLIADDGSGAETRAYLAKLETLPQVRVLRLAHAGNPARARNAALREADGEFVAFLDSDDEWEPTKLSKQIDALRADRASRWSYTAFLRIDARGSPLAAERHRQWTPHAGDIFAALVTTAASIRTPSVLAERALIEEAGAFDESCLAAEDYDLWMRLALRSTIALVDEPLVRVRVHTLNHSNRQWPSALICRDRSLHKLQAVAPPRYRALLQRARMQNSVQLARSYALHCDRRSALRTLYRSSAYSWRYPRWWWATCMALVHANKPRAMTKMSAAR